jgi:hypothetical protein
MKILAYGGYFMKIKKVAAGVVVASFVGIGMFSSSQQVSAAIWHKGTPRFLRGTWSNKYNLWYVHKNNMIIYEGYSKQIGYFNPQPYTHVMYKRYHHTYKFRVWNNAFTTFKWTVISRNKFILGNGLAVYRYHK